MTHKVIGSLRVVNDTRLDRQAYFVSEVNNGNSGASFLVDCTQGNKQRLTLTASCALSFTPPSGASNIQLKIIQDAIGGRVITWSGATFRWSGTSVVTATANAVDIVNLYWDGSVWYGAIVPNYV